MNLTPEQVIELIYKYIPDSDFCIDKDKNGKYHWAFHCCSSEDQELRAEDEEGFSDPISALAHFAKWQKDSIEKELLANDDDDEDEESLEEKEYV